MSSTPATYWSHWGMRQAPFGAAAVSRAHRLSPTHEEALARLHFLVENRRRLGLLLGDSGSGKTLLLARLAGELWSQGIDADVVGVYGAGAVELLWAVAVRLGLNPRPNEPLHALWGRLSDRLIERRYQQLTTVLLLDDADRARDDALAAVVRLLRLDSSPEATLSVVLTAEAQRAGRLGSRLLEMAELRVDLDPWTAEETAQYVSESVAQVGRGEPLFEQEALARLYEFSGGRPRRVEQIADLALVAAAGQDQPTIDAQTIETVYRELTMLHAT